YLIESLETTHRWAKLSLQSKTSNQALYGIVQGGKYKDLRLQSAKFIAGLPFDGFAIGGEFGSDKKIMSDMLGWVNNELPETKPRHLLGIGYLDDIPLAIKNGVDTFDCIVPTHFARHGTAYTSTGKLDLFKSKFLTDKKPLDTKCNCVVCGSYKRNYICHLLRAKEITPLRLLTLHNLYFFNNLIKSYRDKIKKGLI
ncbi:MAG: tRNA guanosine(34) transglycosylase Tgt, partial [Patescibacteria group bacterium]